MIAPGFAKVEEVFNEQAKLHAKGGLAFSVTVRGEPVVDLVAGEQSPGVPWTSDTRTGVASVTKGWATMCLHLLFDRGQLTYDMRIADVWPEFAQNGKQDIRLHHIMNHTAGLLGVGDVQSLVDWHGGGWDDLDAIAARLAEQKPVWEPGTKAGYHAVTFGWLVGEVVRRITGQTLGTFFKNEFARPLGIRTAIGVPIDEQSDIAKTISNPDLVAGPAFMRPIVGKVPERLRNPNELGGMAFLGDGTTSIMDAIDTLMADGRWQAAEVPASNGVSSAKDLARLYALLANGGEVDGIRIFSEKSMDYVLQPGLTMTDEVMGGLTNIPVLKQLVRKMATASKTQGGYDAIGVRGRKLGYGKGAVGNGGAGGHVTFADPDTHVAGAFVRSAMAPDNKSQEALIKTTFRCVQAR